MSQDYVSIVLRAFVGDTPRRMRTAKWQKEYITVHLKGLFNMANQSFRELGKGAIIVDIKKRQNIKELNYLTASDMLEAQEHQEYIEMVTQYNPDKEFVIAFKSNYGKERANMRMWKIPYPHVPSTHTSMALA
jgi:hypothetical protein